MPLSRYQATSALARPGVIPNAAARPASPYEGQVVYQTDTDGLFVWNGSAWTPPWNTAWGIVASGKETSNTTTPTTETVRITASTFTAVANRQYKITYFEPAVGVTGGAGNYAYQRIRLTNATGTELGIGQWVTANASNSATTLCVVTLATFSAGSTVIVGTLFSNSGTPNTFRAATQPAWIIVEDIGPS